MSLDSFHPLVRDWFVDKFGGPTEPQTLGWPAISSRRHTLIAAPTGSGKTLAAFLVCIDRLFREWLDGDLADTIQVVYVSPLKALSNDIERNLRVPLAEIAARAEAAGLGRLTIRTAVRTGDTPSHQRQQMLRKPPHILVTTPESLYLVLTSEKGRKLLRRTRTVIVDEIHALARDKRGSHLSLSLERLARLCDEPPTRIGLSATQRPIEDIARFLTGVAAPGVAGSSGAASGDSAFEAIAPQPIPCHVVDVGHIRNLDLSVELPPSELAAVCSNEQWGEVYERLTQMIQTHRSTLVFVNTRRMAERIAHRLTESLGEEAVASHHGSLSRELRLSAEQRLKSGQLKAIVATASLEMGIDIGYIDLVCQIGSPRSIATFLQRVGRSGHSLGATPKGRLFPLTRDELLECFALIRSVRRGELDAIEIPVAPLDILAQQVVAAVACEEWSEDELFALCRRAWPYRDLTRADFDAIVGLVTEGLTARNRSGALLHRDQLQGRLRARQGARLAALTSGGAIPEAPLYRVIAEPDDTFVGTVDEHFAVDSAAGDVFVLGNNSWRITGIRGQDVRVRDAEGAPPNIPFWFGEAPGRTMELSAALADVRREMGERLREVPSADDPRSGEARAVAWVRAECGADEWAASQAVRYVVAQVAAMGLVPTTRDIVFERFFDESGGMQLVIHAPLGHRINRAWGLALRKRFCRSFDFELQAAATDNGIVLSIGPQHSFPIEQLFKMLGPHNGQHLLQQALLAVPFFPIRWRWNVSRALAVLRFSGGKKVPFFLQRFRADDLLAAAFPETVGCLENHHGDVDIPDHPLVRQTMNDCLDEALDVKRWLDMLGRFQQGDVRFIPCDTREPSPFSHELLNANPYAFLDGADLEERRTRAVTMRRSLAPDDFRDLTRLDPAAVATVVADAQPVIRNPDELHDALLQMIVLAELSSVESARDDAEPSRNDEDAATGDEEPRGPSSLERWFERLVDAGRAARVTLPDGRTIGIAAERWPVIRAAYASAQPLPEIRLPERLDVECAASDAWVELVRGQVTFSGPITVAQLANRLALDESSVAAALEALEGQGAVMRGCFGGAGRASAPSTELATRGAERGEVQWCDRRLLARIHRLTLDGLRRRIQPVTPDEYLRFLVRHQRWGGGYGAGPPGVREALAQLEGFELPAAAWERHVLGPRVAQYDPQWLDQLFLAGEATWGRLRPPRRADDARQAAMTRTMPVAITLRDDLSWLLPPDREAQESHVGPDAQRVLDALQRRGALFASELRLVTRLEPERLDDALRELAALGLVTSDAFAAVRAIVSRRPNVSDRQIDKAGYRSATLNPVGRWSRFPGPLLELLELAAGDSSANASGTGGGNLANVDSATHAMEAAAPARAQLGRVERWCWLLLRRYGVVFRDVLQRESAAPSWQELVPIFRRLELRGELRGGRFVSGVSGEQYATESAVTQLRQVRDEPPDEWLVISAADPLNLSGIVVPGPRVPATHRNALVLLGGRCVAARRGGQIEFFAEFDDVRRAEMLDALTHQRRRAIVVPAPAVAVPVEVGDSPAASEVERPNKVRQIRQRWSGF